MSESFHVGDVADGCPAIEPDSVDLSFTSPPYFKRHGYDDKLMIALGRIWARVMKVGHRAYLNFGQIKEKLDRALDAQRLVLLGGGGQLVPAQTIIWVKSIAVGGWEETCPEPTCKKSFTVETLSRGHFQPINSPELMNYCWEYVFSFVKKEPGRKKAKGRKLARTAIGVPYTDKSNLERGTRGKNGDVHCPGDIWFIPHETTGPTQKKTHQHEFPPELPKRAIKVNGLDPGSLIFDPFLGGGTTAFVARELGHRACGYDKNQVAIDSFIKEWTRV